MSVCDIEGKILFFDTETTGMPDHRLPYEHPSQPHIVQFAWILAEAGAGISSEGSVIIDAGVSIPEAAARVHGITTERAKSEGIPPRTAMSLFVNLARKAKAICCHNLAFDELMIEISLNRCEQGRARNELRGMKKLCTMKLATDRCQLLPTQKMLAAGITGFKAPSLLEAHTIIVGEAFDGAHDARFDVRACRRVFEQIRLLERGAAWSRGHSIGV
jgi:DNA polymerase-3 subunit epsilon